MSTSRNNTPETPIVFLSFFFVFVLSKLILPKNPGTRWAKHFNYARGNTSGGGKPTAGVSLKDSRCQATQNSRKTKQHAEKVRKLDGWRSWPKLRRGRRRQAALTD